MTERIAARIAELLQEREMFVTEANQRLAAYDAAIGELKALLSPQASEAAAQAASEALDLDGIS